MPALIDRTDHALLIGNEQQEAGDTLPVEFPATGEEFGTIGNASASEVDAAVSAAKEAAPGWARKSAGSRARLLLKVAQLVDERRDELARTETSDVGKPIRDSTAIDANTAIDALEYFAGIGNKIQGDTIPVPGRFLNYTVHEPYGVVAAIIPWNFPLLQAVWKIAPAVVAGNTIVLKPAEQASLTPLILGGLFAEAGFPPGVVNVVTGTGEQAGAALVDHPDVAAIAFTGSGETGSLIATAAAKRLVPVVSMELGGKSANVVFEDADVGAAAAVATNAIFGNSGQVCTSGSRLLVHSSIHDEVVAKILDRIENKISVGDPLEEDTTMGPLISGEQWDRVNRYVELGREAGAEAVVGGGRPGDLDKGHFFEPTVFTGVDNGMEVARGEIFGPVLSVIPFEDEDQAVAIANDTDYGLAAGLQTRDVARAHRVAGQLEAGMVWINSWGNVHSSSPYGGYKKSGYGREMGFGVVEAMTQVKSVWVGLR